MDKIILSNVVAFLIIGISCGFYWGITKKQFPPKPELWLMILAALGIGNFMILPLIF